ncbi:MAG: acyl-CoA thioesterase [Deltaproteobacteria bacterium]|nr:MAG: acyl-CoA thioesterase [Deltaproteobacteria bacterium]
MPLFTLPRLATERDIDANGHVNNIVYVQWMQDVAVAHSDHAGCTAATTAAGCAWVARSHRIEYLRPAFAGDRILLQTWLVDATRKSTSLRRYRMIRESDGTVLARGETLWVLIDSRTGRPRTIPPEIIGCFALVAPEEEP